MNGLELTRCMKALHGGPGFLAKGELGERLAPLVTALFGPPAERSQRARSLAPKASVFRRSGER